MGPKGEEGDLSMSFRHSMAVNLTPLVLRIALGVVFVWAGYAKVWHKDQVTGDVAVAFAQAGMITADDTAAIPTNASESPDEPLPETSDADATDDGSVEEGAEEAAEAVEEGAEEASEAIEEAAEEVAQATEEAVEALDESVSERARFAATLDTTKTYEVRRLEGLAIPMQAAIDRDQWPTFLSSTGAMKGMAWAAAITELLCGAMILIGLLTRLSALGLAGVMLGALWMTQIGPAIAAGNAYLGFLPDPQLDNAAEWTKAWKDLLFQFTLLMTAVGVFFAGAGKLSIDGIMFREKRDRARSED